MYASPNKALFNAYTHFPKTYREKQTRGSPFRKPRVIHYATRTLLLLVLAGQFLKVRFERILPHAPRPQRQDTAIDTLDAIMHDVGR